MSYDNERSVALKAEFAYDAGLAGVRSFLLRNKKAMKNMALSLKIITKTFYSHLPSPFIILWYLISTTAGAAQAMTCSIVFHL